MPPGEKQAPDAVFEPNLVNSVCYLVQAVVQLTTFAVNYVGQPFNADLSQNPGLAKSLSYMALLLFALNFDIVPGLGAFFGLVAIPWGLQVKLLVLSIAVYLACDAWERSLRASLPAAVPPEKGYMRHAAELKAIHAAQARAERGQKKQN